MAPVRKNFILMDDLDHCPWQDPGRIVVVMPRGHSRGGNVSHNHTEMVSGELGVVNHVYTAITADRTRDSS